MERDEDKLQRYERALWELMNTAIHYGRGPRSTGLHANAALVVAGLADVDGNWTEAGRAFAARMGTATAALATPEEIARRPVRVSFWYLHDNHTTRKLAGSTLDMIIESARIAYNLDNYGMLCQPILLTADGKEVRRAGVVVHGHPDRERWNEALAAWVAAVRADAEVMTLLTYSYNEEKPL